MHALTLPTPERVRQIVYANMSHFSSASREATEGILLEVLAECGMKPAPPVAIPMDRAAVERARPVPDYGNSDRYADSANRRSVPAEAQTEFQTRVDKWMAACFPPAVAKDIRERNHRFLEESLELVQSLGCTRDDVLKLVDYVFGRPAGKAPQEVGGVMVTLAALCSAASVHLDTAAEDELGRVWTKIEKIRAKHDAKPRWSPLPGTSSAPEPTQGAGETRTAGDGPYEILAETVGEQGCYLINGPTHSFIVGYRPRKDQDFGDAEDIARMWQERLNEAYRLGAHANTVRRAAARREALEEAAKLVEDSKSTVFPFTPEYACSYLAKHIRHAALATPPARAGEGGGR